MGIRRGGGQLPLPPVHLNIVVRKKATERCVENYSLVVKYLSKCPKIPLSYHIICEWVVTFWD